MKASIISIICAAALSACGASAQSSIPAKARAACTVELNGDSVLFGFVNNANTGWRLPTTPAQWLRNHGYTVTDKTAGGLRTYDLVRGYVKPFDDAWPELYPNGQQRAFWLEAHDAKVVVIQTGINDYRTVPFNAAQVAHDYRYLVDYLRGQGKTPVITGVTNMDPGRASTATATQRWPPSATSCAKSPPRRTCHTLASTRSRWHGPTASTSTRRRATASPTACAACWTLSAKACE